MSEVYKVLYSVNRDDRSAEDGWRWARVGSQQIWSSAELRGFKTYDRDAMCCATHAHLVLRHYFTLPHFRSVPTDFLPPSSPIIIQSNSRPKQNFKLQERPVREDLKANVYVPEEFQNVTPPTVLLYQAHFILRENVINLKVKWTVIIETEISSYPHPDPQEVFLPSSDLLKCTCSTAHPTLDKIFIKIKVNLQKKRFHKKHFTVFVRILFQVIQFLPLKVNIGLFKLPKPETDHIIDIKRINTTNIYLRNYAQHSNPMEFHFSSQQ